MGIVIQPRKLAAIDIALLGPVFIILEFAAGVILSVALGVLTLGRNSSFLEQGPWDISRAFRTQLRPDALLCDGHQEP